MEEDWEELEERKQNIHVINDVRNRLYVTIEAHRDRWPCCILKKGYDFKQLLQKFVTSKVKS